MSKGVHPSVCISTYSPGLGLVVNVTIASVWVVYRLSKGQRCFIRTRTRRCKTQPTLKSDLISVCYDLHCSVRAGKYCHNRLAARGKPEANPRAETSIRLEQ